MYSVETASELMWTPPAQRENIIYRIDDSLQGLEAPQHRKHMLDGVCDGGQLQQREEVDGGQLNSVV